MRISKETPARRTSSERGFPCPAQWAALFRMVGGQDLQAAGESLSTGAGQSGRTRIRPGLTQKSGSRLRVRPKNSWPWEEGPGRSLAEVRRGWRPPDHPRLQDEPSQRGDRQAQLGWEAWPGWTLSLCC